VKEKKEYKILAIIPAKGRSRRLPGKNIRPLAGKPLIAYSIEAGLSSNLVDRVIVSTDEPKIAQVSKEYGAEVPFMRPSDLARDHVSDTPVLSHALKWLEENEHYYSDIVVLLRPTTPLREKNLIDRCITRLITSGASSVRSVRTVGHWHPYWMLKVNEEGWASEFLPGKTVDVHYQSQLLPPLYVHDGYCDVFWRDNVPLDCLANAPLGGLYGKSRQVEFNNIGHFINIDTLEEFKMAELIIMKSKKKK
jgi:CMP-N,N'-diacetyllegionaminic acid synthase